MTALLTAIIGLFSAPAPSPTPSPLGLEAIIQGVEKAYNGTNSLEARFEQRYHSKVFRRSRVSKGKVRFARPGFMDWNYESPKRRRYLLDGKDLWIHRVDEGELMVRRDYDGGELQAALRFLWGRGRLDKGFKVALLRQNQERALLRLVPERPSGHYDQVRLAVRLKDFRISDSVVVDAQGNENRFKFIGARYDKKLNSADFRFAPPKGLQVTEISP